MKKKTLIMICLAAVFSVMIGPIQSVAAATWPVPSTYPSPGEGNFTSLNGVFSPVSTQSHMISNGADEVGLELNANLASQTGSIWSNQPFVDLDKSSFKLDMRIYLGNTTSGADGLAFALTSDRSTKVYSGGASLGIWGITGKNGGKPIDIATTGLPNSFAIVVDTKRSRDGLIVTTGMDQRVGYPVIGSSDQYIGSGYPGQASMYAIGFPNYKTELEFNNPEFPNEAKVLSGKITNGSWQDLSVEWHKTATGGNLIYRLSGTGFNTVTRALTWTNQQINDIFGYRRKLYLGFTSATGNAFEPHVVAIKSLADFITVKPEVTLKREGQVVGETTILQPGDQLTYDYNLNVDNLDGSPWPMPTITLPKGEYFDYLKADGEPAQPGDELEVTLTVDGVAGPKVKAIVQADQKSAVITNMPELPKNKNTTVTFSLPAQVKLYNLSANQAFSDDAGTVNGGSPATDYKLVNTADSSNKIKYVLGAHTGDLFLTHVPGFVFKKYTGTFVDPGVADIIRGIPGDNSLPSSSEDFKKWLNTLEGGGTEDYLEVLDTRPDQPGWHLQMKLSPFKLDGGDYVLGDNGSQTGGKAEIVLIDNEGTGEVARVKDNNDTVTVKNMPSGGGTWQIGDSARHAQALMTVKGTPSVRAGKYHATATWTLAHAPE
ncbi:lectin-like domain-containing protein [Lacticaseibacillus zeae]|uniref:WxL domain-containing protein n=1 Tax=Lacticaseibacillus zeae subsp. silagei TaxID=3068307 RepID=A0ABD7ZB94_LACZE|nr:MULTISPECIES: WxL domain-containing protein [Lacticaseibacillus]OFR92447.1 lectin [Lactobacillus sp. HMSC068F07]WLV84146.1 WxL domain-containing protein [Lacticaseibacillus sp. NCIMB 15475]WLV86902.1 WxL domain-containing protein [Lacticaseibacillus sp. NCIMB 15474]